MASPTNAELVAAMRELLAAFAESTEEGASEDRCFAALARHRDLLDQADAAQGPASDEWNEELKGGTENGRGPSAPSSMRLN